MKHYSASLVGQNNAVDDANIDSRLQIGADDSLEIAAPHTDSTTGVGLEITTADPETKYLRGDGQEALITGLQLGLNNITALHVPLQNATADAYVDSQISQSAVGTGAVNITIGDDAAGTTSVTGNLSVGGNATISGNTTITGNLDVTGETNFRHQSISTYTDTFIELNVAQDVASNDPLAGQSVTGGVGGILVESDVTYSAQGVASATQLGGLRFNGAFNSGAGRWEYNNGVTGTDGSGGTWVPFTSGTLTAVQGGNGISVATTGTIDGLTASATEPVVSVDLTATAAGTGGLAVTTGTTGDGNETLGIAANGITEQMLNVPGTAGQAGNVLSLVDATAGTFGWVPAGGGGTTRKITSPIGTGTGTQTYSVDTTTTNSQVTGTNLGIDVIVAVYEDAAGGGRSQIIPESVTVTATSVTVVLPAGGVNGDIVIIG